MRHALVEDGIIVNVIEIDPRTAGDWKNAVTIPENIFAGIGDKYHDGRFYHENPETHEEEEILPYDPIAIYAQELQGQKIAVDKLTVDTDYRLLMLEFQSMA